MAAGKYFRVAATLRSGIIPMQLFYRNVAIRFAACRKGPIFAPSKKNKAGDADSYLADIINNLKTLGIMKKIFALAAALVSMSAVMTSCGNNGEANDIMTPRPQAPAATDNTNTNSGNAEAAKAQARTLKVYVPVLDGQQNFIDEAFVLTVDGKTYNFKTSELTESEAGIPIGDEAKTIFDAAHASADLSTWKSNNLTYKALVYTVPGTYEHATVTLNRKLVAVSNRPADAEFNLLLGPVIMVDGSKMHSTVNAEAYAGLYNTDKDVQDQADLFGSDFKEVTFKF